MESPYLTYVEYTESGGTLAENVFKRQVVDASAWLDHVTQHRIPSSTGHDASIKLAMSRIVEVIPGGGERVTSFNNGVTSFSFADVDEWSTAYDIAMRFLSLELTTMAVD